AIGRLKPKLQPPNRLHAIRNTQYATRFGCILTLPPNEPPHPSPLPRKRHGGEGELALRLPAILPLPRLGGEGWGEGVHLGRPLKMVAVSRCAHTFHGLRFTFYVLRPVQYRIARFMESERKTMDDRNKMTELERIRHSCAHVLATAILRIWPEAQFASGPPV